MIINSGNIIDKLLMCIKCLNYLNLTLYFLTESVIQFLKRHAPVISALFSPVDPYQLACAQVDGVYVVDIRKPKRWAFFFIKPIRLSTYTSIRWVYECRIQCVNLER